MKEKNLDKGSKIKLNVSYVEFIGKLMREKLCDMNKEKLRVMYLKDVKVKSFRNVIRVGERVKREKLRSELEKVLKGLGLKFEEFVKVSDKIRDKIREKKESKYISVE